MGRKLSVTPSALKRETSPFLREKRGRGPALPDKIFFKIGEVAEIAGVPPYILRYWESEFPTLHPEKSTTGQRLYRQKDVRAILRIKHLLYTERYTIRGARRLVKAEAERETLHSASDALRRVKEGLLKISSVLTK